MYRRAHCKAPPSANDLRRCRTSCSAPRRTLRHLMRHRDRKERPGSASHPTVTSILRETAGCSTLGRFIAAEARRPRPTPRGGGALSEDLIAYTGTVRVDGDRVFFDLDVSWNESSTGTRQIRTFELAGNQLMITAEIINPMSGKPARHRLMFEKVRNRFALLATGIREMLNLRSSAPSSRSRAT